MGCTCVVGTLPTHGEACPQPARGPHGPPPPAVIFALLPDSLASAGVLTLREREALAAAVARDHAPGPLANDLRGAAQLLRNTLRNSYMWLMFMAAIVPSLASHTYQLCAARGLGASRRHIA